MTCIVEYSFCGLQREFVPAIEHFATARRTVEEDFLWHAGGGEARALFVAQGALQLSILHPSGGQKTLAWFKEGSFLPAGSQAGFCERIDGSLFLRPMGPCRLLLFSEEDLGKLLCAQPMLGKSRWESSGRLVRTLAYEISRLAFEKGIDQVVQLLYHQYCANQNGELAFTQQQISDFLCIDRTNTAKALAFLRARGIVETKRGKICILQPEALCELHDCGYEEGGRRFVEKSTEENKG